MRGLEWSCVVLFVGLLLASATPVLADVAEDIGADTGPAETDGAPMQDLPVADASTVSDEAGVLDPLEALVANLSYTVPAMLPGAPEETEEDGADENGGAQEGDGGDREDADPREEEGPVRSTSNGLSQIVHDKVLPLVPLPKGPLLPDLAPALDDGAYAPLQGEGPPAHAAAAPSTKTDTNTPAEPPGGPAAVAVAAALAASGVAVALKSAPSSVRSAVLLRRWLWIPLYARVAKDRILDHDIRQDIVGHLRAHPGACVSEIHEVVGMSINAVTHHLRVLESHHLVQSVKSGRRRCFFASGDGLPARSRLVLATLSSEAVRRVYTAIQHRPGIRQQELAASLGVSPTSIIFHAKRLEDAGVVERARSGRALAYYPSAVRGE